jgi:hypothetical protein
VRDLKGYYLVFGHHLLNARPPLKIQRVDVPVRLEKRLAALLDELLARSANGRIEWKDENGRSLKEIQEENLPYAQ